MELTAENYYSQEANLEYMSVSQFKDFAGTYGIMQCEFKAMEKLHGRWIEEMTTPMLVGSYVDAYFEGTLRQFVTAHPECFRMDGELRQDYKHANKIIKRIEKDPYFMKHLSGEKQRIMTGEMFGSKWKIKMDSYVPGEMIVDLKVMRSITDMKFVKDVGYMDFIRYWGYDIQGAVYQEIVRQNTGKRLPFYIAAASKEKEPDIRIIKVGQNILDEAMYLVRTNMTRVMEVKNGEVLPEKCDLCDCCRYNRVLTEPVSIADLTERV